MKFKVGDKVRIKSISELERIYNEEETVLVSDMFGLANYVLIVNDVHTMAKVYWIAPWFWPEECLEPAFDIDVDKGALGELLNG